jgi:sodium pump decarboxylase gamma subunit
MELLGQGFVLMLAGMGIVYLFLITLIVTTKLSSSFVAKFDHILPQDTPKKTAKPAAANDDENIALAIAVAMG